MRITIKGDSPDVSRSVEICSQEFCDRFSSVKCVRFEPGSHVYNQDSEASEVFLIRGGVVKLSKISRHGRERVLAFRYAGEILGAASSISQRRHVISAIAITHCTAFMVDSHEFAEVIHTEHRFSWWLQLQFAKEISDHHRDLAFLGGARAEERVIVALWKFARAVGSSGAPFAVPRSVHLPCCQRDLAAALGLTPEHLSRTLRQLERSGVLMRQARKITILRRPEGEWFDENGIDDSAKGGDSRCD